MKFIGTDITEALNLKDIDCLEFICMVTNEHNKASAIYKWKGKRYRWVHTDENASSWYQE